MKHTITLTGPKTRGKRIGARLLRDVLDLLLEGGLKSVRLRTEGRSTTQGHVPAWMKRAAEFDVVDIHAGSPMTIVELEMPTLEEAAAEGKSQHELWPTVNYGRTALGFLQESLADAVAGKEDSDLFDDGLISVLSGFEGVFASGVGKVEIDGEAAVTVLPTGVDSIKRLKVQTPLPRAVRVSGKLDLIRHSDLMFTIVLADGTALRGVADQVGPQQLASFFGKDVVVSGHAVFRPSGAVLRVEADQIDPADGDVSLWAGQPKPLLAEAPDTWRVPQGSRTGISAVIGKWPGDETDEEMAAALATLS